MAHCPESWNRMPTAMSAVFGIDLPYRPPKSALGAFLWRRRFWLETTSGLSLLEPWEKVLTLIIVYLLLTLVGTGLYKFLPLQLAQLQQRMVYYFLGHESGDGAGVAVGRVVTGWVARNASGEL